MHGHSLTVPLTVDQHVARQMTGRRSTGPPLGYGIWLGLVPGLDAGPSHGAPSPPVGDPPCPLTPPAQSQRNDATASAARAAALEAENAALARRLVELKEAEIERMNDINRQREEMVRR